MEQEQYGITLFLSDGKTLHFEQVEDLVFYTDLETMSFTYFGKSFGKRRKAQFNYAELLGFSMDEGLDCVKSYSEITLKREELGYE
ncbi:hypothetical protein [Streptococcus marmotae]|uniref:hypothetical protein n=1 Tax=Streptococcus marmotae TaxID=1825069 RepID=UPI000836AB1F|nr:hypothetical protein [Streptococcus marmotae]QBX16917.1 hypothetical protein Javan291_0041 [Streptococcus phage Javan291]